jgi:hypothetical protein
MYQYGETVITKTKEVARAVRPSTLTLGPKKPFSERPVESTRVTALPNSDMAVFFSP